MEMTGWLALCDQVAWQPVGFQAYLEASDCIVLESTYKEVLWHWVIARQEADKIDDVRALFKKIQEALSVRASALNQAQMQWLGHGSDLHLLVFGKKALGFACPWYQGVDLPYGQHQLNDACQIVYLPDVYAMSQEIELKRICWQCLRQSMQI